MITLQHTTLFTLELATQRMKRNQSLEVFYEELHETLPWVLLPDAIRAYIGPRQAGHFEKLPNGSDTSWMKYPTPKNLKKISKENASEKIKFHVADGYPKCVIGEDTDVFEFDKHNWGHPFWHELRTHLMQDCMLDWVLREKLIYADNRFVDQFPLRKDLKIVLDGKQLREQVALFEQLGFIKLVEAVYNSTGILMNRSWFDEHVLASLKKVYPLDLAEKTYGFMQINDELDKKFSACKFDIDEEEIQKLILTDDLDDILGVLYGGARYHTAQELE